MYKVLLTTSGLGSRLGNLTKFTNKSLVRIGDKSVISHIIETYPEDVEFVVTLGHYGSHVKQYLTLAHPERKFEFVEVDVYTGEGSSLLYSISLCEEYLQSPFIFHACDTILPKNYIQDVDFSTNWSIGGVGDNSQSYRTINCVNGKIASINEKGEQNFDFVYVGVSGIQQYEVFWNTCRTILQTVKTSDLSDCHVIRKMNDFAVIKIDEWYDIGNIDALKRTRSNIRGTIHVLDKEDENIFIFGLTTDEVALTKASGYNPWDYYNSNAELKQVLDMIANGFFSVEEPDRYQAIFDNLLQKGDHYLLLADYASYIAGQDSVNTLYQDQEEWSRRAILNVARVGKFSSDRTIGEYAKNIWHVAPAKR